MLNKTIKTIEETNPGPYATEMAASDLDISKTL